MRGDQLARQWRVIRAIEASPPKGLTVTEIARREETGFCRPYRNLEALQSAGFPLSTERTERANRWAFKDTFKIKIPPLLNLTEQMSIYHYRDLPKILKVIPIYDSLESVFKKVRSTNSPQTLMNLHQVQPPHHLEIALYKHYSPFREKRDQISNAVPQLSYPHPFITKDKGYGGKLIRRKYAQ